MVVVPLSSFPCQFENKIRKLPTLRSPYSVTVTDNLITNCAMTLCHAESCNVLAGIIHLGVFGIRNVYLAKLDLLRIRRMFEVPEMHSHFILLKQFFRHRISFAQSTLRLIKLKG